MGYDASGRIGTGCRPGMVRLKEYIKRRWRTGDLGCFNPASRAGGGPSLHADGRAFDAALDATKQRELERGDELMHWLVEHHEEVGLQEVLWRGYLWSYQRRSEGIRFGFAQAAHMNHVHIGVDYNAADNWTEAWLKDTPDEGEISVAEADRIIEDLHGQVDKLGRTINTAMKGVEKRIIKDNRSYIRWAVSSLGGALLVIYGAVQGLT